MPAVLVIGFAFLIKKQPGEEKPRVKLEEFGTGIYPTIFPRCTDSFAFLV